MRIVLFEDDKVQRLEPITLSRPAYSIGCGGERLVDWALSTGSKVQGVVRPYLQAWQDAEYPSLCRQDGSIHDTLLVNARVAPIRENLDRLNHLLKHPDDLPILQDDSLAAVVVPSANAGELLTTAQQIADRSIQRPTSTSQGNELESSNLKSQASNLQLKLFNHPHHIIKYHLEGLVDSLNRRIESGEYREVRDGVFSRNDGELPELVHTDTSQGPIVIEPRATIRPFVCLKGPIFLASECCVNEHTFLKNAVMVGQQAKVGGEISASIIEACSNKQHSGFLGHSYLGQWVNLGAGTSNSNLKNTYGSIRMETATEKIDTGMQFLGCVVGDYTKSAINTSIFTGKLIGACSMLYGFVTTNVPSFVNYARSFGQMTDMNPEVFAATQRRAFERRGIQQQDWQVELIQEMYRRAAEGRQLADEPLSL